VIVVFLFKIKFKPFDFNNLNLNNFGALPLTR